MAVGLRRSYLMLRESETTVAPNCVPRIRNSIWRPPWLPIFHRLVRGKMVYQPQMLPASSANECDHNVRGNAHGLLKGLERFLRAESISEFRDNPFFRRAPDHHSRSAQP
jgi:hypothetical protein